MKKCLARYLQSQFSYQATHIQEIFSILFTIQGANHEFLHFVRNRVRWGLSSGYLAPQRLLCASQANRAASWSEVGTTSEKVRNGAYGFGWCLVEDRRLDGSSNDTLCIQLSHLGAYLKSIELNSVPQRMRDRLAKYQYECAKTMIRALNSPNLDGVEAILTSMDYTLFRDAAVQHHWNTEAMRKLGVCIGG